MLSSTPASAGGFGIVSTVAGTGVEGLGVDGAATDSALARPRALAVDASGNLYIADSTNNRIQVVDTDANVTTFAGTGVAGKGGDGLATQSALKNPDGVAVDTAGNVYISDSSNYRIQKVDAAGNVSTYAGPGSTGNGNNLGPFYGSSAIVMDAAGNLFVTDSNNYRVRKIGTDGNLTIVAGTGDEGIGDDGPATGSALAYVMGLAVDAAGNLYIADSTNHRVQKVTLDRVDPSIQMSGLEFTRIGDKTTITYTCADTGGSELASCTATFNSTAVNSGDTITATRRGTQTLTVTATDNAGNTATNTVEDTAHGQRELIGDQKNIAGPSASIARLYMATFTRNPEGAGFEFWEDSYGDGMTLQEIADYFATSPEFVSLSTGTHPTPRLSTSCTPT